MAVPAFQSLDPTGEHGHAIARLSHELQVPLDEVGEIYRAQLARLGADAQILSFLGVLATRNTRDILRRRPVSRIASV
jgi:Protein of unknown function (DUF3562)